MLQISATTVRFLILKAHQYDTEAEAELADSTAHSLDDDTLEELDERAEDAASEDPVYEEMKSFIEDMNEDEQVDLVALLWLGRDGASADDWWQIRAEAARAHNDHSAAYLLGTSLLADYLSEGLAQLGYSEEDGEI